jgi:hypothetical protein
VSRCLVSEVAKRFAEQTPNHEGLVMWESVSGGGAWGSSRSFGGSTTISARGRLLKSYRENIAVYLGDGFYRAPGEARGKRRRVFLKNGDRFTPDTDRHQGHAQRACFGPTASFGALEAAGVDTERLTLENLVAWQADTRTPVIRDPDGQLWEMEWFQRHNLPKELQLILELKGIYGCYHTNGKRFHTPKVGMFIENGARRDNDTPLLEDWKGGVWHILGAVVVKWQGFTYDRMAQHTIPLDEKTYLCALDESSYFCSELSRPGKTVDSCFKFLKPAAVVRAEREGKVVKRQGEWFCVATGLTDQDLADQLGMSRTSFLRGDVPPGQNERLIKGHHLPLQDPRSNRHVCWQVRVGKQLLVSRTMRHRDDRNQATGEHDPLVLGEVWFEAVRNTEVRSFTAPRTAFGGGRYD